MSNQTEKSADINLEDKINQAKEMLGQENVPITKLASFVEDLLEGLSAKYPKMMELAMSAGAPAAGAAGAEQKESASEPTAFDVALVSVGDKKLNVIKEIRAISGLGLSESKAVVDKAASGTKSPVKSGVDKKTAQEIKVKLEAVGAKVELIGVED